MRKHFNFLSYLAVAIGCSSALAGSYEDFFVAIKRDDPKTVAELLQRGFDPNTPGPQRACGLYLALQEPAPKVVDVLLAAPQTNIECRTGQDESPLMMAALKGQTEYVRKLIQRGADVNKPGWAPLHYAATGGHLEIMELLLEHHAFIDAESPNGTTPLMMAASYGTPQAVKLLLDAGADTAMKNRQGMSAIDFAQRYSRKEAAEVLASYVRSQQPRGKW
jgi:ankyrin repeat protein